MESNLRNFVELVLGIGFAWMLKWKMYSIHSLPERTPVQAAVFFAGLFVFYLAIHIIRILARYYRMYGVLNFGTVTGSAFVALFTVTMLFAHSADDIFHNWFIVIIIWLFAMVTLVLFYRLPRRRE